MRIMVARGTILVLPEVDTLGPTCVGKVVAFGKGKQLESGRETDLGFSLYENSRLIYRKGSGQSVEHEDRKCLLLRFDEVLGMYPDPVAAPASVTNPDVQEKKNAPVRA